MSVLKLTVKRRRGMRQYWVLFKTAGQRRNIEIEAGDVGLFDIRMELNKHKSSLLFESHVHANVPATSTDRSSSSGWEGIRRSGHKQDSNMARILFETAEHGTTLGLKQGMGLPHREPETNCPSYALALASNGPYQTDGEAIASEVYNGARVLFKDSREQSMSVLEMMVKRRRGMQHRGDSLKNAGQRDDIGLEAGNGCRNGGVFDMRIEACNRTKELGSKIKHASTPVTS
ncbi:hypothetical protein B0H34DRAFT_819758 [Crassisporium funariophilum]|nr:hypothetical protein B0H34DRAFT_819758 [Crassisporium funariophilum]